MKLNNISIIKFDEKGLVPAIAQEYSTGRVLMLAYMNKEALGKTLSTGRAHYFSRSRNKLWLKGETSGNFQEVKSVYYDCDEDAILLSVHQTGAACHTGEESCFFRMFDKKSQGSRDEKHAFQSRGRIYPTRNNGLDKSSPYNVLSDLFETIKQRKTMSPEKSYVASLYAKGIDKILDKIKEESDELIDAAKNGKKDEVIHETADLVFHNLVLLGAADIDLQEILDELKKRAGTSGIEEKAARKNRKQ